MDNCQSCLFADSHQGAPNQSCPDCWTRYIVGLIDGLDRFGVDRAIVRKQLIEVLIKGE